MRYVRSALLCAAALAVPLALAAAARAQTPATGMVLYDAGGTPVAILTPLNGAAPAVANDPDLRMLRAMEAAVNAPFDGGFQQFFAAQEASMRALKTQMQTVMRGAFGGQGQTIEVAIPPAANGQVSGTYVWSVASGQGHCAETVTFSYSPAGGAPQVAQRKTGNVCGKWDQSKTGSLPAMTPPERAQPSRPKLLEVNDPARTLPALPG